MQPKQILIIDDDPRFRNTIKRTLKTNQYIFVESGSVKEGINTLDNNPEIRVVLLDLKLSDGSGVEVLRHIKEMSPKNRVVIITAHEEQLAAEKAKDFSVFGYLPKTSSSFTQSIRFSIDQAFKDIERQLLKEKNEILIGIQQMVMAQGTVSELNDILRTICQGLKQLIGAYSCHMRLYDLKRGDYQLAAFAGPDAAVRNAFSKPKRSTDPFSGLAARDKRPLLIPDLQSSDDFNRVKEEALKNARLVNNDEIALAVCQYFESIRSAFVLPITTNLFADEIDALFSVTSDSVAFFSEEKRDVIAEFATQAAMVITRTWLKLRKDESHQDYRRINSLLEEIGKELGRENAKLGIYDIVIRGISEIIKPEAISIYLCNKTTGLLENEADFRGLNRFEPRKEGHSIDQGLTALVYSSAQPVRVPNLQKGDRRKPATHENANQKLHDDYVNVLPSGRVDHYLAVPMIIGNEVIGAIQLLNKTSAYYHDGKVDRDRWLLERGFSDDCENLLSIAASHLAVAIKNADLLEERRKQISHLAILKDVGRFTTSEKLGALLGKIIHEAAEVVQAKVCLLFLPDESGSIILQQRYGISTAELPEASYEIGEGITGNVVLTRKSYLSERDVPNGKYDREILEHLQKTYGTEEKIESVMIVPIQVRGELLGVIKAVNKGDNQQYDKEDLKFFEDFASYVGLAIENTQRHEAASAERNVTLSNLVRAVVHEINRTQAIIPIKIQLIRDRLSRSNYDIDEMIDVIEDTATQTMSFANSIQGFSASRIGETQQLDINSIIDKAVATLLPALEKDERYRHVSLELELSPEALRCSVYETPLIQVIQNIMINAYQAMEHTKTARLKIRTTLNTSHTFAQVFFTDTGCGIKKEFLPQIFEAGFTTKNGGAGIGLWLSQEHLTTIDANVSVDSRIDEGTNVTVEIPLAESETQSM